MVHCETVLTAQISAAADCSQCFTISGYTLQAKPFFFFFLLLILFIYFITGVGQSVLAWLCYCRLSEAVRCRISFQQLTLLSVQLLHLFHLIAVNVCTPATRPFFPALLQSFAGTVRSWGERAESLLVVLYTEC